MLSADTGTVGTDLLLSLVALGAVGDLDPTNPISTYLLDRRLYVQRTPPAQVPKLGLDLVLDEPAPFTAELAQVIRAQARPLLVAGFFG
jgi:hypothetical protein